MTVPGLDDQDRFRLFYVTHFDALLAYAVRRVAQPEDAADVVADAFLVAWRRIHDLPDGDEARLWMFGVARKVLANQHRSGRRRDRLGHRLRQQLDQAVTVDHAGEVAGLVAVRAALNRLSELDREVLALTVWEELAPSEIGEVLGVSAQTVRTRLSRARVRLRELVGNDLGPVGHVTSVRPQLTPEEG